MKNHIKEYYNNLATEYDKNRFSNSYGEYIDRQERTILYKLLKNNRKDFTLDIPCGTGRLLNFAMYGADISPNMIAEAQKKHPDCKFSECSALDTGFKKIQFDTILSFHFIMHLNIADTKMFLEEAHRILKPNGKLIFDFPSKRRRQLVNYKSKGWHASNHLNINDIKAIDNRWIVRKHYGVLFLPIHRIPVSIRRFFIFIDNLLCRSFLRTYASYIIIELEKK